MTLRHKLWTPLTATIGLAAASMSYGHPLFRAEKAKLLDAPPPKDRNLSREATGRRYKASYEPRTARGEIPLGELHDWAIRISNADPHRRKTLPQLKLRYAGDMPQHLHGLPSVPTITSDRLGGFLVHGIKFHMPGWWRIEMTVADGEIDDLLVFDLDL